MVQTAFEGLFPCVFLILMGGSAFARGDSCFPPLFPLLHTARSLCASAPPTELPSRDHRPISRLDKSDCLAYEHPLAFLAKTSVPTSGRCSRVALARRRCTARSQHQEVMVPGGAMARRTITCSHGQDRDAEVPLHLRILNAFPGGSFEARPITSRRVALLGAATEGFSKHGSIGRIAQKPVRRLDESRRGCPRGGAQGPRKLPGNIAKPSGPCRGVESGRRETWGNVSPCVLAPGEAVIPYPAQPRSVGA
jgi:hypothetical protein